MSRFTHRQPVWGTISVVLLSALFLSPMTGAALLHALALDAVWHLAEARSQATPQPVTNGEHPAAPQPQAVSPATAPRRTSEEDEDALRRATDELREQLRQLRFPRDPDIAAHRLAAEALVVVLPTRTVLLVPDTGPCCRPDRMADEHLSPRAAAARPAAPRAPPVFLV